MVLRLVYILSTYCTERICFYFTSFDRRCLLFVGCFFRFRGHVQLPKLSIRNKFVMKMLFCTIIVVIMSNHIRRITLNLLCTVTCCVGSTDIIFFKCQFVESNITNGRNNASICTIHSNLIFFNFHTVLASSSPVRASQTNHFLNTKKQSSSFLRKILLTKSTMLFQMRKSAQRITLMQRTQKKSHTQQ